MNARLPLLLALCLAPGRVLRGPAFARPAVAY